MRTLTAVLVAAFLMGCAGKPATTPEAMLLAMQACKPHEALRAALLEDYGETPVGAGLDSRGLIVQLFVGAARSWTLVAVHPEGLACYAGSGQQWLAAEEIGS